MAKKPISASKTPLKSVTKAPVAKAASPLSTPVRNSAVPKTQAAAKAPPLITHDMICKRAYEIWQSGTGGSEHDNWTRAERELRGLK
jgi:hypothetical protein